MPFWWVLDQMKKGWNTCPGKIAHFFRLNWKSRSSGHLRWYSGNSQVRGLPLAIACTTYLSGWPGVLCQLRCFTLHDGLSESDKIHCMFCEYHPRKYRITVEDTHFKVGTLHTFAVFPWKVFAEYIAYTQIRNRTFRWTGTGKCACYIKSFFSWYTRLKNGGKMGFCARVLHDFAQNM